MVGVLGARASGPRIEPGTSVLFSFSTNSHAKEANHNTPTPGDRAVMAPKPNFPVRRLSATAKYPNFPFVHCLNSPQIQFPCAPTIRNAPIPQFPIDPLSMWPPNPISLYADYPHRLVGSPRGQHLAHLETFPIPVFSPKYGLGAQDSPPGGGIISLSERPLCVTPASDLQGSWVGGDLA